MNKDWPLYPLHVAWRTDIFSCGSRKRSLSSAGAVDSGKQCLQAFILLR